MREEGLQARVRAKRSLTVIVRYYIRGAKALVISELIAIFYPRDRKS